MRLGSSAGSTSTTKTGTLHGVGGTSPHASSASHASESMTPPPLPLTHVQLDLFAHGRFCHGGPLYLDLAEGRLERRMRLHGDRLA